MMKAHLCLLPRVTELCITKLELFQEGQILCMFGMPLHNVTVTGECQS